MKNDAKKWSSAGNSIVCTVVQAQSGFGGGFGLKTWRSDNTRSEKTNATAEPNQTGETWYIDNSVGIIA